MTNTKLNSIFFQTEFDEAELKKECQKVSQDVSKCDLKIVDVIKDLGTLLTDRDPHIRHKGTWILVEILNKIQTNFLSGGELEILVNFFCDRLKDHYDVIPAVVKGLNVLILMDNLPVESTAKLLRALFENIVCQQHAQDVRENIFKFLSFSLLKKTEEVKQMELDFVSGVLSTVDGERNPQLLLYLFKWLPEFYSMVALKNLTEDAFEIVSCYFPIDFPDRSEEIQGVKRTELANHLESCLTAVPEFAEYCLPLVYSKLDSDLKLAKMDCLKLLIYSCCKFNAQSFEPYLSKLWIQLEKNIFSSHDPPIIDLSIKTLARIVQLFCESSKETEAIITNYLKDITPMIKAKLHVKTNSFENANKLSIAISKSGKAACNSIIQTNAAFIKSQYVLLENAEQTAKLLNTLVDYSCVYATYYGTLNIPELIDIPRLCINTITDSNPSIQIAGLNGCDRLLQFIDDRSELYPLLLHLLVTEESQNVRTHLLNFLKSLACYYPNEILSNIVESEYSLSTDYRILTSFQEVICIIADIQFFTTNILCNFTERCFHDNSDVHRSTMYCLYSIVYTFNNDIYMQNQFRSCNCLSTLVKNCLKIIDVWDNVDEKYLKEMIYILRQLIKISKNQEEHLNELVPEIIQLFDNKFNFTCSEAILISLLDGLLTKVKRNVQIVKKNEVYRILISSALQSSQSFVQLKSSKILANLINKTISENEISAVSNELKEKLISLHENDDRDSIYQTVAWFTRSLVMRNHSLADFWIAEVLTELDRSENISEALGIIILDDDSLNRENDCNISILYKQKFFNICLLRIIDNSKDENVKCNYLKAIAHLVKNTPSQIIVLNFSKISKYIINCLNIDDNGIVLNVLKKIEEMLDSHELFLLNYISDLIPEFIKLSTFNKSMEIRISALYCLNYCSSYDLHVILPNKSKVLYGLIKCLDDPKRLVRKAAVETRCKWFLVGL